jgi:hypothetical protein
MVISKNFERHFCKGMNGSSTHRPVPPVQSDWLGEKLPIMITEVIKPKPSDSARNASIFPQL